MIKRIKKILFADDKSARAWSVALIILAGTSLGFIIGAFNVHILGKPLYPYGTFFCPWPDTFGDFMVTLQPVLGTMEPYKYLGYNYFPFTYIFLYPLRFFPGQTSIFFCLGTFLIFTLFYCKDNLRDTALPGWSAIIFTFLSYPVLFTAERANIEMFLFIFTAAAFLLYQKKFFYAAGALFAMAISMKLYPAVFLILFIKDKKFKPLIFTVLFSLALFYISLLLTGNDWNGFLANLAAFSKKYTEGAFGIGGGHSLFGLIRLPIALLMNYGFISSSLFNNISSALAMPYLASCFFFFAFASLVIIFQNKNFWRAVLALTICSVWLPYVSFDYTLLELIIPFFLFISSGGESKEENIFFCVCFGLLFIPMNWNWLCASEYYRINTGVPLKTIILGFMLLRLVIGDFKEKSFVADAKKYFTSFR